MVPRRPTSSPKTIDVKRPPSKKEPAKPITPVKTGKAPTQWGKPKQDEKSLNLAGDQGQAAPAAVADDDEPVPEGRQGDLEALEVPDAEGDVDECTPVAAPVSSAKQSGPRQEKAAPAAPAKKGLGHGLFSMIKNIAGTRMLTRDDLMEAIGKFREGLLTKNVAAPVCEQICESVMATLEGKKLETYTVAATVKKAVEEALTKVLTPRREIDVLRDALAAKQAQRPYVVVFCGVNGVGKSTSLSKVAFWLLNNGLSVLVAACDTFRSGAVEQLDVHVKRLSQHGHPITLFSQGYGKEPAYVARAAVEEAKGKGTNVVLIDTAGRMQDNEGLMRALASVVSLNNPDLILFVGEALVGNDGVDQLVKFSRSLSNHGERTVDGVFLTKFDTVDDKMGAAVSMVYATGAPIVFVGVGQHYNSVRKLNVSSVVQGLLR